MPIIPVCGIRLTIPLDAERKVKGVRMFLPDDEAKDLPWKEKEDYIVVHVPEVRIYTVVEVELS